MVGICLRGGKILHSDHQAIIRQAQAQTFKGSHNRQAGIEAGLVGGSATPTTLTLKPFTAPTVKVDPASEPQASGALTEMAPM